MEPGLARRPLLCWEKLTLRVDLDMLELWLNREVAGKIEAIRELRLGGEEDAVELRAKLAWEGIPGWFSVRLRELRLYRGVIGASLDAVQGPLGLPVPLGLVASLIERHAARWLRLDPGDRILLLDARSWLPGSLDLHVCDARCRGRWLELGIAPGSLFPGLSPPPEVG